MKVFIIFIFGCLSFALADEPQCSPSSKPVDDGILSDAEFWQGVDGAEYITELDDKSHAEFTTSNPKAFVMYYATCESSLTLY
jgi:hypothetical protein